MPPPMPPLSLTPVGFICLHMCTCVALQGPYQLGLDWIKARNTRAEPGLDEEEAAAEEAAGGRRQQRRS